jgi:hypothetical protein
MNMRMQGAQYNYTIVVHSLYSNYNREPCDKYSEIKSESVGGLQYVKQSRVHVDRYI